MIVWGGDAGTDTFLNTVDATIRAGTYGQPTTLTGAPIGALWPSLV